MPCAQELIGNVRHDVALVEWNCCQKGGEETTNPGECPTPVLTLACGAGNSTVRSPGKRPRAPSHHGATDKRKTERANVSELLLRLRYRYTAVDGCKRRMGQGA